MKNKLLLLFYIYLSLLFNLAFADINTSIKNNLNIADIKNEIAILDRNINDNKWIIEYENYNSYKILIIKNEELQYKIRRLEKKSNLTIEQKNKLQSLKDEAVGINSKLLLLGEHDNEPFKKLLLPGKIDTRPEITNPLGIFYALSYQEKLKIDQKEFHERCDLLDDLINDLEAKKTMLEDLIKISKNNNENYQELEETKKLIKIFKPLKYNAEATKSIYDKKIHKIQSDLKDNIAKEIKKLGVVGGVIGIFFALLLLSKYMARKYLKEVNRLYAINKTSNITFIIFTLIFILFAYIENAGYLATILGFASAGIAIALKEWFMSIIGWFVIFFGNSIHVGNRIRIVKDGSEYLGDVIDISLLKTTILEDVTLTTFERNRRAGRVIYIPNNYIFTNMIANYTHDGIETVWDGIDFIITFDSNINKAASIARDIALKYSKTFSDNTRQSLNKLRSKYHFKHIKVEPKVFTLITPYGIKISVWYLTNSYATLSLRSTISASIINAIKKEDDIILAYPTQAINILEDKQKQNFDNFTEDTK